MKKEQTAKIQQIRQALCEAGICHLDEQAAALGLPRSTAYTVIAATHKNTGLTAMTIKRMLESERIPPRVRSVIADYIEERVRGDYGHAKRASLRFVARMNGGRAHGKS
jgi:hypothetical protein